MRQPCHLLSLITMGFLLKVTLSEKENCLLPNWNISLHPGLVRVTWDCNVSLFEECTYEITLGKGLIFPLKVSKCFFEHDIPSKMDVAVHNGLEAELHLKHCIREKKSCNTDRESLTRMPEGKNNTSAENFSCVVKVSSVNCSWTAGREAPQDTQYSLTIRNDKGRFPCEDYRKDSFGRQVGCFWKYLDIDFSKSCYVQVVGSSEEATIRFYDQLVTMNNYVILDPPRDIKLNVTSDGLEVTWNPPEIHNKTKNYRFSYSIRINEEEPVEKLNSSPYIKKGLPQNQKFNISMRVKWLPLKNSEWSRWSEPIIYDPNIDSNKSSLPSGMFLIVLGVVTATSLFLLLFLCHRFRIWKRLFPKVPQPTMKLFDPSEQKELLEHNTTRMENLSKKAEVEECICSPITEIP